jgi:hypothetical protein
MAADVSSLDFDPKNSVFKFNSVDISGNILSLEFTPSYKDVEITKYGDSGFRGSPGIEDCKISLDLLFNQLTTTGTQTVIGAAYAARTQAAFEYYPAGTTSGNTKVSGTGRVTGYRVTGSVGGKVRVAAEITVDDGAGVTFGTAA